MQMLCSRLWPWANEWKVWERLLYYPVLKGSLLLASQKVSLLFLSPSLHSIRLLVVITTKSDGSLDSHTTDYTAALPCLFFYHLLTLSHVELVIRYKPVRT